MEKKEPIKVNLSTFFLIIAIIIIAVMGYFIFRTFNEKTISEEKVSNLNLQVNELKGKIDKISNITSAVDNTNTTQNNTTESINNLEKYKGIWYEKESDSKANEHQNPTTIKITSVNNNQITFDLYITRTADFNNVKVNINNNYGTFEATEDALGLPGQNVGKIKGNITLSDNTIKLVITESTVMYLDAGSTYTFTYKSTISKIEGIYWPKIETANDAPGYAFFQDGTVELQGNYTSYGTYQINDNIIKIKFTRLSGPDKENETINQEETLKIIDSNTLLDETNNFKYVK